MKALDAYIQKAFSAKPNPKTDMAGVIFLGCLWVMGAALAGPLVLWARKLPLFEAIPMGVGSMCLLFPVFGGLLIWKKLWKYLAVLVAFSVLALAIINVDPGGLRAIGRYFHECQPQRERALEWVRGQEARRWPPLKLPGPLSALTFRGEAYRHVAGGEEWVFLPMVRYGIDNESGYAWSKTGRPPPRPTRLEVVRTRDLGGGWFLYETT